MRVRFVERWFIGYNLQILSVQICETLALYERVHAAHLFSLRVEVLYRGRIEIVFSFEIDAFQAWRCLPCWMRD